MILMGMADENGRWPGPIQRRRQQAGRAFRRVERPPGIENKTATIRVRNLNAAPADLPRAAMDGQPNASQDPTSGRRRR